MATYVIGDLPRLGLTPLMQLLETTSNIGRSRQTFGCMGDLINRGPESLETLRFIKSSERPQYEKWLLGNH